MLQMGAGRRRTKVLFTPLLSLPRLAHPLRRYRPPNRRNFFLVRTVRKWLTALRCPGGIGVGEGRDDGIRAPHRT